MLASVPKRMLRCVLRALLLCTGASLLSGCYYLQAVRGQAALTFSQRSIEAVVQDERTPAALRDQLVLTQRALDFAHDELGLPDNGSYRKYVALDRDYLVVNVFATAPFSLQARTWCYPFLGCLAYRGYFSADGAQRKVQALQARGLDVATSKVPAYSTLGRLRDPVLSTMLKRSDDALVSLLFHELSHQLFYARDDTAFNESFASFVAAEGLRRWRAANGLSVVASQQLAARRQLRSELLALAERFRQTLAALYRQDIADAAKRQRKAQLFAQFAKDWRAAGATSAAATNNAALLPLVLYNDLEPAFRQLLHDCDGDLPCLYRRAAALADASADERTAAVQVLMARQAASD